MTSNKSQNELPLTGMCDLTTGECGATQVSQEEHIQVVPTPRAEILFFTDPYCSHCWGFEPVWRKFLLLYRLQVSVRYVYGGLLSSWDGFSRGGITSPADLVPHFAEVAERFGQPIDSAVQISDPPSSSYPASIALHIVRKRWPEREEAYLRRLRQALFLESRNFARLEVLTDCAVDIGLDGPLFQILWQGEHGRTAFARDLQETQEMGVGGFPTLLLKGMQNQAIFLRGTQPFAAVERAFLDLSGTAQIQRQFSVQEVLRAYGSGTTREFDEALGLGHEGTAQALLAAGARRIPLASDALWKSV